MPMKERISTLRSNSVSDPTVYDAPPTKTVSPPQNIMPSGFLNSQGKTSDHQVTELRRQRRKHDLKYWQWRVSHSHYKSDSTAFINIHTRKLPFRQTHKNSCNACICNVRDVLSLSLCLSVSLCLLVSWPPPPPTCLPSLFPSYTSNIACCAFIYFCLTHSLHAVFSALSVPLVFPTRTRSPQPNSGTELTPSRTVVLQFESVLCLRNVQFFHLWQRMFFIRIVRGFKTRRLELQENECNLSGHCFALVPQNERDILYTNVCFFFRKYHASFVLHVWHSSAVSCRKIVPQNTGKHTAEFSPVSCSWSGSRTIPFVQALNSTRDAICSCIALHRISINPLLWKFTAKRRRTGA